MFLTKYHLEIRICNKVNLNLKDFNIGVITNMEDNTSKQELKVYWTRLLKPSFKTKAGKTKTRWTIILK